MTGAFAASGLIFQPWLPNTWDKIAKLSVIPLIIITAFIIWRNEHNKLKPVFSLQFVSNSLINRTPVPTLATLMAWAFRLEVKSECKRRITGLSGKLLCIQQPTGKTTEHQYLPLTFTKSVTSKDIDPGASVYLDIVNVLSPLFAKQHSLRAVEIPTSEGLPNGVDWENLFNEHGDYLFRVQVTGNEGPTVSCYLKFTWDGIWTNAKMEMIR